MLLRAIAHALFFLVVGCSAAQRPAPTIVRKSPSTVHCDYAISSYIMGDCSDGDRQLELCRVRIERFDDTPWKDPTSELRYECRHRHQSPSALLDE